MNKLKIWSEERSWDEAEALWDAGAKTAAESYPLKRLKSLPSMPGMTPETAKHLKWKSFRYILFHREGIRILRSFLRHPFRYGMRYFKSLLKRKSYQRQDDFFLYGISSMEAFLEQASASNALLVVGFSYCQKPHECPSGRFTPDCIRDPSNSVCRQCDIGKVLHALPEDSIPLLIPTVHYIGEKMFELAHSHPKKKVFFLITACEMTLEMFGDWGNMVGAKGIGVRLDGRICNTMKAFELSEQGIKPGLTVVTQPTQNTILQLIHKLRKKKSLNQ